MNRIHCSVVCLQVLGLTLVFLGYYGSDAFSTKNNHMLLLQPSMRSCSRPSKSVCRNWLSDLWEEVIEFSTYGPSERRLLKERREKAAAEERQKNGGDVVSTDSFQRAQQKFASKPSSSSLPSSNTNRDVPSYKEENDSLSLGSFQAAVASRQDQKGSDQDIDFDGYKLRDLLVQKWGVPLDVDFQRGYGGNSVHCTILPVAFGSSRCRHETEIEYLMHLQGVVEVLKKYDNLDPFLFFVQTTKKTPKPGVESAVFVMQLDQEALKRIL